MTIGQKIRASRRSAGMRGEDLGAKVGLTKASISQIEKGRTKGGPTPELIIKIAEALGDDSILLHAIETNPIYKHILPKIFPDLNNIRRDPAIIFARLADEAEEAMNAARIMAGIFTNVDPQRTPRYDETFKAKMEQVLDIKRCVELLEFELMASGVITKGWLDDVYARQQRKCIEHGHHKPNDERRDGDRRTGTEG